MYVNAKQYERILRRREQRAAFEANFHGIRKRVRPPLLSCARIIVLAVCSDVSVCLSALDELLGDVKGAVAVSRLPLTVCCLVYAMWHCMVIRAPGYTSSYDVGGVADLRCWNVAPVFSLTS